MRLLLSPAKTFRKDQLPVDAGASQPLFPEQAAQIMSELSKVDAPALMKTMDISEPLAQETAMRHQDWGGPFHPGNARTAIHAFHGEVYRALGADRWSGNDLDHAQDRLRIISGLYGLLRPLDLIQEYRLEMGGRWSPKHKDSMYAFWSNTLAQHLTSEEGGRNIVNLASQEYFKAVDHADLSRAPTRSRSATPFTPSTVPASPRADRPTGRHPRRPPPPRLHCGPQCGVRRSGG